MARYSQTEADILFLIQPIPDLSPPALVRARLLQQPRKRFRARSSTLEGTPDVY
jgi:hypothetical protein